MRVRLATVGLFTLLGVLLWLAEAVVRYSFVRDGSFWGALFTDLSAHEVYTRSVILVCLVAIGVALSHVHSVREQAKQLQSKSEKRFHYVALATRDAAYDWDIVADTSWRNERYHELFATPESTIYDRWEDAIHPGDRNRIIVSLQRTLECNDDYWSAQYRFRRADGEYCHVVDRGYLVRDSSGRAIRMIGAMTDISERKRAEDALRFTQFAVDRASDAAFWIKPDGNFFYVNEAACRSLGYSRDELLSMSVSDIDPNFSGEAWPDHWKLLKELSPSAIESHHRSKDGRVFPVEVTVNFVEFEGNEYKCSFVRDISERRRAEEERNRLTAAVEQTAECVLITNEEGTIQYANPAFEQITGYSRNEVIGQRPHPPDDEWRPASWYERLWDSLDCGEGDYADQPTHVSMGRRMLSRGEVWRGRVTDRKKDGTLFEAETTISPIRDDRGTITNYVAVMRDVTHEVVLEGQLRHAQKMEAIGTLASGVAHDFNNLLTAIFGYTDLARETLPEGHAAIEALRMVEEAGRQARGVTNSLLTFSRKVAASKTPVNVGNLVADSKRLLGQLLSAAIEIVDEASSVRDVWVNADATQLQQVLMNLAVNARDAMPQGGCLRITLAREVPRSPRSEGAGPSGSRPQAVLTVQDSGTGMSEETKSRVFEPFFTTKPRESGTGLGMSITHGIIVDHGGHLSIESEPGRGTRVTITLPCCDPPDEDTAEFEPEQRSRGRGEMLVLVEDDKHVRSIMTSTLRGTGYHVLQARDGLEAMDTIRAHKNLVRLVVLDLDVPRKSGESCLREIRQMLPETPVVLVTGSADLEAATELDGSPCLLRKPFRMAELSSTVGRILEESGITQGVVR
ncbi:MAG: PAS domain S-box protein [Phycisphaerales bacterium]|nr:MAG: PAS domain S-box protein [Phycisphaerales bacterium]